METDPDIVNGDCYIAPNSEADAGFLPCGNALYGHRSCCAAGDVCLNSRACYNARFGLTYLSGCSDPDYSDPSCPDKVFDGKETHEDLQASSLLTIVNRFPVGWTILLQRHVKRMGRVQAREK